MGKKFTADIEPNHLPSLDDVDDHVVLVFNQNRNHELIIGGRCIRFSPHGSARVPREVINHPAFKAEAKYFTVKG
jgi:hypothetical protein